MTGFLNPEEPSGGPAAQPLDGQDRPRRSADRPRRRARAGACGSAPFGPRLTREALEAEQRDEDAIR